MLTCRQQTLRNAIMCRRINPEKVADANALSEEWYGNEEELNNMIMQRYSTTLARPPLAGSKR